MGIFSLRQQSKSNNVSDFLMTLLYTSFITFSTESYGVYIMVALTILIYLANAFNNPTKICWNFGLYHKYILSLSIFCFISALWARNADYSIEKGVTLLSLLICFSILYATYYYAEIVRLLKIIMWAGFILAIYSIVFYGLDNLQDTLSSEGRLENAFTNVNTIGMACSTSILIAVYLFRKHKEYLDLMFCVPALMMVAGSGSRKALVMLILGLVFIYLCQTNDKKKNKVIKIFGSIIAIAAIFFVGIKSGIFAGSVARMDGMVASFTDEGQADSSSMLRQYYRLLGFAQLYQTPFLGIGMGNARLLAYATTGHDCYLHCNYAELAANGGIVGLVLYYWIYIPLIRTEYRARKKDYLALLILFLILLNLVMDYGAVTYYNKSTYFFLMIVFLHINSMRRRLIFK